MTFHLYKKHNVMLLNNTIRSAARGLFKSRHNTIEERNLGVKVPSESKVERLYRGTGGEEWGWRNMSLSPIFLNWYYRGNKLFL